jgi:hypothetical protein
MGHVHYDLEFFFAGVDKKRRIGKDLFGFSRILACELKTPCGLCEDVPRIKRSLMKTRQYRRPGAEPIEEQLSPRQRGREVFYAHAMRSLRVS